MVRTRIAVLGAGGMGSLHARIYASLRKREALGLAGVYSRHRAKSGRLAKAVGAPAFTDLRAILTDESIDAVDVTVPSALHRRFVVAALNAGKHVFCETPMALTLADADAMIRAARVHRKTLMVAQLMRFVLPYVRVQEAVLSGRLGRLRVLVARRLSRPYWSRSSPRPFAVYGEPVVELMTFDFDVGNWLLGRPRRVYAVGLPGRAGVSDHVLACVEYDGAWASFEGSARMPRSFPFTTSLRVQGERETLDLVGRFTGGDIPEESWIRYPAKGHEEKVRVGGQDPYEAECTYFVRVIQGREKPGRLRPEADREALRLGLAAKESILQKRPVRL